MSILTDIDFIEIELNLMRILIDDKTLDDNLPLGRQQTDDHVRLAIRKWASDVGEISDEGCDILLMEYKEHMAMQNVVANFCEAIIGSLFSGSLR